jgi:16S rRNA processing protein RimM
LAGQSSDQHDEKGRRGSADSPPEPRFLVIGEVIKPHGVRGEVRVLPHTDLPERFGWLEEVYVGREDLQPIAVEGFRLHKQWILLKLAGYDSREAATALRGAWLQVPREAAVPLEEGEYYIYQLEGLAVYTEAGEHLGELVEVLETKANHVYIVRGARGEILLPDTDEVIVDVDLEAGTMTVHLLPGLLP